MLFDWRRYFQLLRGRPAGPGLRARPIVLSLFALFELFTALCLLIDDVLFRGWRRAELRAPVFVIGNPRSGTTILHRVMARDEDNFFFFRTWQIMFPAVVQKTALAGVGRVDRWLGSPLRRLIARVEGRHLDDFGRLHELGLFKPEEDHTVLVHVLRSPDLALLFPGEGFDILARFDVETPAPARRAAIEFYTRCARRQAFWAGGRRVLLSKSPWHSGRVESLAQQFPDCRFVYLVRNPLDVVASVISLLRAIVRETSGVDPRSAFDESAYETVKFFYADPLARLAALPAERVAFVKYDDLMREPEQVIERIYRQLGLPLTTRFRERLAEEVAKMRQHTSRHRYSLDQCSVARERIISDLRPIFDRFGFDTRAASVAPLEAGVASNGRPGEVAPRPAPSHGTPGSADSGG